MSLYRNGERVDVISGAPGTINDRPSKATPVDADVMLLEDSADGFIQKKALLSAFPEKHTQGTDQGLDTGGANAVTAADAADAVTKKHSQGTDLGLDTGGTNPITAATAKAHVDAVTGNPHAVTLEQARTAGNTVAGDIAMANNNITGLPSTPGSASSAASKDYVDGIAQGLVWQQPVIAYQSAPPVTVTGDRVLIEPTGSGLFTGHDNEIATSVANGTSFTFQIPTEGYALRVLDDDNQLVFNGTAWVTFGSTVNHQNLNSLQGGTATERNHLTNAQISALHSQGTDLGLDTGGTNPVTAATIKGHVDSTSNPHGVTKAQVGLTNVTDDAQLKRAAGDIASFTEKAAPVAADLFLIEDSADSGNKKKVQLSSISTADKTVTLFAEWNGCLAPDGADNDVLLTQEFDGANNRTFVRGTTAQATTQDQRFVVPIRLPSWFTGFDASEAFSFYHKDSTGAGTYFDVEIEDASGNTYNIPNQTASSWTKYSITAAALSGAGLSFSAGDTVLIKLKWSVDQNETVDIGEVIVKYE